MELEEEPALMPEISDVAKVAIHAGNRFSTVVCGGCSELLTSELAFTRDHRGNSSRPVPVCWSKPAW
jgi:hypothetical protein